jgi:hypothetical protein
MGNNPHFLDNISNIAGNTYGFYLWIARSEINTFDMFDCQLSLVVKQSSLLKKEA